MFVIRQLLHFRREHPELFAEGDYTPVTVTGPREECLIAFTRAAAGRTLLVLAPRLASRSGFPPIGDRWTGTMIEAPACGGWFNVLTSRKLAGTSPLAAAEALAEIPVGVLVSE
jgi:(1->4)-alpha-D-glucan 1-alpha-D-glucosylmutase